MKLIPRNKLIDLGLINEHIKMKSLTHVETEISYDSLADQIYQQIRDTGITQEELYQVLKEEGWEAEDIQIAVSILIRRKLITFIGS